MTKYRFAAVSLLLFLAMPVVGVAIPILLTTPFVVLGVGENIMAVLMMPLFLGGVGLGFAIPIAATMLAGTYLGAMHDRGQQPSIVDAFRTAWKFRDDYLDYLWPTGITTLTAMAASDSVGIVLDRRRWFIHAVLLFEDIDPDKAYERSKELFADLESANINWLRQELRGLSGWFLPIPAAILVGLVSVIAPAGISSQIGAVAVGILVGTPAFGFLGMGIGMGLSAYERGEIYSQYVKKA